MNEGRQRITLCKAKLLRTKMSQFTVCTCTCITHNRNSQPHVHVHSAMSYYMHVHVQSCVMYVRGGSLTCSYQEGTVHPSSLCCGCCCSCARTAASLIAFFPWGWTDKIHCTVQSMQRNLHSNNVNTGKTLMRSIYQFYEQVPPILCHTVHNNYMYMYHRSQPLENIHKDSSRKRCLESVNKKKPNS